MATGVQPHGDRLLWTFHRIECKGHFVTGLSKGTLQLDANVIYTTFGIRCMWDVAVFVTRYLNIHFIFDLGGSTFVLHR